MESHILGQQLSFELNVHMDPLVLQCPHADRLWKDFLAPPSCNDKVDKGLLQDDCLQGKGKVSAPIGRMRSNTRKKKTSNVEDDDARKEN
ncbi:hypothetical protein BS78_09G089800 [Paspalum vaginatum]|nr:hypothetical protein BS78_09G089800 [Paspalum vaginatum]